jgi:hypothetical protein
MKIKRPNHTTNTFTLFNNNHAKTHHNKPFPGSRISLIKSNILKGLQQNASINNLADLAPISQRLQSFFLVFIILSSSFLNLINPTVHAETTTITASSDVFISQVASNKNQYFRDHLGTGYGYYDGSFGQTISLLSFNTTLPPASRIQKATLTLTQYSPTIPGNGSWSVFASKINSAWNSKQVTWYTQPSYGLNSDTRQVLESTKQINLDVTAITQSWQNEGGQYGIALRSNSTKQGGWLCSGREDKNNDNGGSETRCIENGPKLTFEYITNQPPNEPVLQTPNNGSRFGGTDYSTRKCEQQKGCELTVKFGNIGDPDGNSAGGLEKTIIVLEPIVGGTYMEAVKTEQPEITWTGFVPDGKYRVFAKSIDKQGLSRESNKNAEIIIDTTQPEAAAIIAEPEFSPGNQNQVQAHPVHDTLSLSDPVQYEFCMSLDEAFTKDTHCSNWMDEPMFGFGDLGDEQTYFYKVRTRDSLNKTDNQHNYSEFSAPTKSTQDAIKPVIQNPRFSNAKRNEKNIRIKDFQPNTDESWNLQLDITEKHLQSVQLVLKDSVTQSSALEQVLCDNKSATTCDQFAKTNQEYAITSSLNSLDISKLPDGAYIAEVSARDKAGNSTSNQELILIKDTTPGKINVSSPINSAFVNTDTLSIQGQIVSEDSSKLFLYTLTSYTQCQQHLDDIADCKTIQPQEIDLNQIVPGSLIFDQLVSLSPGKNVFLLKSLDSVGNSEQKLLEIFQDKTALQVETLLDNQDITPSLVIQNRKPHITFHLQDIQDLANPAHPLSGINPDTFNLSFVNSQNQELALVVDGKNVSNLGEITPTCAPISSTQGQKECTLEYIFKNELQPDGRYTVRYSVKDKAGNQYTKDTSAFTLDSHTYLALESPVTNGSYTSSILTYSGRGEENSTISIFNQKLNLTSEFILSPEAEFDISKTSLFTSKPVISCDTEEDFDNTNLAQNQICTFKIPVKHLTKPTPGSALNSIQITATDIVGNTLEQSLDINLDIFGFEYTVTPDTQFISADGNGKQDGIQFQTSIKNPNNSNEQILIQTWTLEIQNQNDQTVRILSGQNSLPSTIYFDGKNEDKTWLEDGMYHYIFHIQTEDNPNLQPISGSFQNVTKNTTGIFITSPSSATPTTPFITTKGTINLQGQASVSTQTPSQTRFEDIQVKICHNIIGLDQDNNSCDFSYLTKPDSDGFFSMVLPIIRLGSITEQSVTAQILDKFGNSGDISNTVYIRSNTIDPFTSVRAIPTYSGINKTKNLQTLKRLSDEYQANEESLIKLQQTNPKTPEITTQIQEHTLQLSKQKIQIQQELSQLKQLVLEANVTQDTQQVELSYTDLTSTKEITGNEASKKIGWIDNTPFEYTKHILQKDPHPEKACDKSECNWRLYYPIPDLAGGIYDIQFIALKGETKQSLGASVIIDANVLARPMIFDIDKRMQDGSFVDSTLHSNSYYTNSSTIQIKGAASPGTQITIQDLKTNQPLCFTQTNGIGIFTCEAVLPVDSDEQNFELQVISQTTLHSSTETVTKTEISEPNTFLTFDTKAPTLVSYKNLNNEHSQFLKNYLHQNQPSLQNLQSCKSEFGECDGFFRQSGDTVEVEIQSSEVLDFGFIKNQDEHFKYSLTRAENPDNPNIYKGYFQAEGYAKEGNYTITSQLQDLAGNSISFEKMYTLDNSSPPVPLLHTEKWGEYTGFQRRALNLEDSQKYPAYNRLLQTNSERNFATKHNQIIFKGTIPASTYPVLVVDNQDTSTSPLSDTCSTNTEQSICPFELKYTFTQEKSYRIQFYAEDQSGNRSNLSQQFLIEYDTKAPEILRIQSLTQNNNQPLVNFPQNPVTNSLTIQATTTTEPLADIEYNLRNPNNLIIQNQTFTTPFSTLHQPDAFNLGTKLDEKNPECIRMQNRRRVGVCEDGLYHIEYRSADSSDNETEVKTQTIERDTVNPEKPKFTLSLSRGGIDEFLGITLETEANAKTILEVNGPGLSRQLQFDTGASGQFASTNLISALTCDGKKYTVKTVIRDQAGNTSPAETQEITSSPCLSFGRGGDIQGTSQNKYADQSSKNLPPVNLQIGFKYGQNYSIDFFSIPAPILTYIESDTRGVTDLYGMAISKYHPISATLNIQYLSRNEAFEYCGVDKVFYNVLDTAKMQCVEKAMNIENYFNWELLEGVHCSTEFFKTIAFNCMSEKYQNLRKTDIKQIQPNVQHSLVTIVKINNDSQLEILDTFWNDNTENGTFNRTYHIGENVKVGDKLAAKVTIFGDFDVDGMKINYRGKNPEQVKENKGLTSELSNQKEVPENIYNTKFNGVNARVLDVPYFNQYLSKDGRQGEPSFGTNMCGAASAVMVAGYFGKLNWDKTKGDWDLKRYTYKDEGQNLPNHCKSYGIAGAFGVTAVNWHSTDPDEDMFCLASHVGGMRKYLLSKSIDTTDASYKYNFEDIKASINNNKPVILSVKKPVDHIFVVKGYLEDGGLIVNDPYTNMTVRPLQYSESGKDAIYYLNEPGKPINHPGHPTFYYYFKTI